MLEGFRLFIFSTGIGAIGLALYLFITDKTKLFIQQIRADGPVSHIHTKQNTPTMAGMILVLVFGVIYILMPEILQEYYVHLSAFVSFALIGGLDDLLKIMHKKNMAVNKFLISGVIIGLGCLLNINWQWFMIIALACWLFYKTASRGFKPLQKLILQLACASLVSVHLLQNPLTWIGLIFLLFAVLFIVGVANAVNLSDGLDGLVAVPLMLAFGYYAWFYKDFQTLCLIMNGFLVAFLFFNKHPAKVFMGDVGALGFGAVLATIALDTQTIFHLIPLGFVFLVNILSVIMQVLYFKWTGKRLLRMSPLHHHFEYLGFSEKQIVLFVWLMQFILFFSVMILTKLIN